MKRDVSEADSASFFRQWSTYSGVPLIL